MPPNFRERRRLLAELDLRPPAVNYRQVAELHLAIIQRAAAGDAEAAAVVADWLGVAEQHDLLRDLKKRDKHA